MNKITVKIYFFGTGMNLHDKSTKIVFFYHVINDLLFN